MPPVAGREPRSAGTRREYLGSTATAARAGHHDDGLTTTMTTATTTDYQVYFDFDSEDR